MALTPTLARTYLDAAAKHRRDLVTNQWQTNVDFRVQKPFGGINDEGPAQDRVAVPEDWARTRQKTAQLSFQVPKILAKAKRPEFAAASPVVTALTNDLLTRECRAAYMIDEVLADVVNAAGLMVSVIGVDIRTESVEVDVPRPPIGLDPMTGEPVPDPQGPIKETVDRVVSQRFYWTRISPGAFLWPAEFTSSDWNQASWLAYDAWLPLADAKRRYKKIPADFTGSSSSPLLLSEHVSDAPKQSSAGGDDPGASDSGARYAKVTTMWYKAACYDEAVAHPDALRTLVFVEGVDEPVEHDDTDWQVWVDERPEQPGQPGPDGRPGPPQPASPGHYLGLTKFPIRVGTLTYISDLAVPPSDSQAARPQVREMIRSRSQMIRQRDHSVPIRWYDVNRLDELTVGRIQKGEWLDMIPVNGPGERVIGEVARASYPRESFGFANVIGSDLDRTWSMSNTQLGTNNDTERSATEVGVVANANGQRLDYEKARVNRYLVEGAEVLFSLAQRFMDETRYVEIVGQDGAERLAPVTAAAIAGDYAFDVKADSSDRIDTVTKQGNALKMYNVMAQSPSVNRQALEAEIFELHGFDPAKLMAQPKEKGPEPANVSYRFSGEDLLSPITIAILLKSGMDLGQKDIEAAQMLIRDAVAGMRDISPTMTPSSGAAAPPQPAPQQTDIEPPLPNEPILKRLGDGTRML